MRHHLALLVIVALSPGCRETPTPVFRENLDRERLTRVNFRPDGETIRSSNVLSVHSIIPVGTRARVTLYSEKEIRLVLSREPTAEEPTAGRRTAEEPSDEEGAGEEPSGEVPSRDERFRGDPFRIVPLVGERFPTTERGLDAFLDKYLVDPGRAVRVEDLGPQEMTEKVLRGHATIGMSKEQVYACLGPPFQVDDGRSAIDLTREEILASDRWIYPEKWILVVPDFIDLYFGDGLLQKQVP